MYTTFRHTINKTHKYDSKNGKVMLRNACVLLPLQYYYLILCIIFLTLTIQDDQLTIRAISDKGSMRPGIYYNYIIPATPSANLWGPFFGTARSVTRDYLALVVNPVP